MARIRALQRSLDAARASYGHECLVALGVVPEDSVLCILREAADAVEAALAPLGQLASVEPTGEKDGQYRFDIAAEAAALEVLMKAGLSVLSEESGLREDSRTSLRGDEHLLAVVDPVDGSTNAHRGIPWYATSLCVLDGDGPLAAVVVDLAHGTRFEAARHGGARKDGVAISPSGCTRMGDAIVAVNGYPRRNIGWDQYRSLGAAALDMCAVAEGVVDAFAVSTGAELGPWDYMGAMLICVEAGAAVSEARGRDLVARGHADRRAPLAASTPELLVQLEAACVEAGGL